jgi:predicted phosphoribosyltransferase
MRKAQMAAKRHGESFQSSRTEGRIALVMPECSDIAAAEIAEAGDKKISLQIMSCFYNVHSYWNTVRLEQ